MKKVFAFELRASYRCFCDEKSKFQSISYSLF